MTQRIGDALSGKAREGQSENGAAHLIHGKALAVGIVQRDALAASRQIGPGSKSSRFHVARPFGSR